MVRFENAHLMDPEELKELIDEEYTNPTLERLVFIETVGKDGEVGKIFPSYFEAYKTEDDGSLTFLVSITQSTGGEFGLLRVWMFSKDFGVSKRVWDKPPTKGLSKETLWIPRPETEVQ